jgi:hypothetical protein
MEIRGFRLDSFWAMRTDARLKPEPYFFGREMVMLR